MSTNEQAKTERKMPRSGVLTKAFKIPEDLFEEIRTLTNLYKGQPLFRAEIKQRLGILTISPTFANPENPNQEILDAILKLSGTNSEGSASPENSGETLAMLETIQQQLTAITAALEVPAGEDGEDRSLGAVVDEIENYSIQLVEASDRLEAEVGKVAKRK